LNATVERMSPAVAILELVHSINDLRTAMTQGQEQLGVDVAAARSSVELWLARLDATVATTGDAAAEDLAALLDLSEELRSLGMAAGERAGDAAGRLTAIETTVTDGAEHWAAQREQLGAIDEKVDAAAGSLEALTAWTEASNLQAWIVEVR